MKRAIPTLVQVSDGYVHEAAYWHGTFDPEDLLERMIPMLANLDWFEEGEYQCDRALTLEAIRATGGFVD